MSELHPISAICTDPVSKDERKADVVFVHGLMGDPFKTWRHGDTDDTSWPHWLAAAFPEIGVWTLGYPAALSKWPHWLRLAGGLFVKLQPSSASPGHGMALQRRAVSTLDRLTQKSIGQKPLIFVCHSLGGLLVKQVIHTAAMSQEPRETALAGSVRDVLFLATPHHGADLATLAKHLRTLLQASVVVDDLQAHGAHLESLSEDYKTHAGRFGIQTHAYYETIGIGGSDTLVVNSTSANPGIGKRPVPLDRDHGSICKPRRSDDPVCERLREILQELRQPQQASTLLCPDLLVETQPQAAASTLPPPVEVHVHVPPSLSQPARDPIPPPCQRPRAASRFFGREEEVQALVTRLGSEGMTVVAGAAGLGKTALAAEALRRMLGERPRERLADTPFPHGIVYVDLYAQKDQPGMAWRQIAESVGGSEYLLDKTDDIRAREACRGRHLLLIVEGGEEADGGRRAEGGQRPNWHSLLDPLQWEGSLLWLTRPTPTSPRADIVLGKPLEQDEANHLLEYLTTGAPMPPDAQTRTDLATLLARHPLALTWAGGLLQQGGIRPQQLVDELRQQPARALHDPEDGRHTLQWLFQRSVRLLDPSASGTLAAAGLLAHTPFPLSAMCAATGLAPDAQQAALRQCVQSRLLDLDASPEYWRFDHALGHHFAQALAVDLEEDQRGERLQRLMAWADRQLQAELASNLPMQALAHAEALLQAEAPPQGWQPLAENLLYDHHDRLEALGRLGECLAVLRLIEAWLLRMPAAEQDGAEWQREGGVIHEKLGDLLQAQGDLAGAQQRHEASLRIRDALATRDPDHAGWQRDLSVSQNKLGDLLQAQGDLAGAQQRHEASLRIRDALATRDPDNAGWQRDLAVSWIKLGTVSKQQGDAQAAQTHWQRAQTILQMLVQRAPDHPRFRQDLAWLQQQIAQLSL